MERHWLLSWCEFTSSLRKLQFSWRWIPKCGQHLLRVPNLSPVLTNPSNWRPALTGFYDFLTCTRMKMRYTLLQRKVLELLNTVSFWKALMVSLKLLLIPDDDNCKLKTLKYISNFSIFTVFNLLLFFYFLDWNIIELVPLRPIFDAIGGMRSQRLNNSTTKTEIPRAECQISVVTATKIKWNCWRNSRKWTNKLWSWPRSGSPVVNLESISFDPVELRWAICGAQGNVFINSDTWKRVIRIT